MSLATGAAIGIPIGLLLAFMKHDASNAREEQVTQRQNKFQQEQRATQEVLAQQRNLEGMREATRAQLGSYLAEGGVPYGYYGGRGMESYIAASGGRHGG